jgi:hypothetical protein
MFLQHTKKTTEILDAIRLTQLEADTPSAVRRNGMRLDRNARISHSAAHGAQQIPVSRRLVGMQVQSKHERSNEMNGVVMRGRCRRAARVQSAIKPRHDVEKGPVAHFDSIAPDALFNEYCSALTRVL